MSSSCTERVLSWTPEQKTKLKNFRPPRAGKVALSHFPLIVPTVTYNTPLYKYIYIRVRVYYRWVRVEMSFVYRSFFLLLSFFFNVRGIGEKRRYSTACFLRFFYSGPFQCDFSRKIINVLLFFTCSRRSTLVGTALLVYATSLYISINRNRTFLVIKMESRYDYAIWSRKISRPLNIVSTLIINSRKKKQKRSSAKSLNLK